jgi:GT2 family glycosyltransferase
MSVSVIIATKDRPVDLLACLRSLAAQTRPPDEIIVVDASNALNGGEQAAYQAAAGDVPVHYERARRAGLPSQRNQGLEHVSPHAHYVCFFDDDLLLDPHYCQELLAVLDADLSLVGAGGWILNPQAPPFERWTTWILRLFLIYGDRPGHVLPSGFNTPLFVGRRPVPRPLAPECLEGCNAWYRVSALRRRRFDPAYERFAGYAYAEDVDFSYALGRAGRYLIAPAARLVHNVSPAGRLNDLRYGLCQAANRARFVRKHLGGDPYHLACYLWAMFGIMLLNLAMAALGRSPLRLVGTIAGVGLALAEWRRPIADSR